MFDFKFEKAELLPGMYVIRVKGRDAIVGYTYYFEQEKAWTWIRKDKISTRFFKTEQEAVEMLVTSASLEKMDGFAEKMGVKDSMITVLGNNKENEAKL